MHLGVHTETHTDTHTHPWRLVCTYMQVSACETETNRRTHYPQRKECQHVFSSHTEISVCDLVKPQLDSFKPLCLCFDSVHIDSVVVAGGCSLFDFRPCRAKFCVHRDVGTFPWRHAT